ncbi:MAG: hypothetical protein ACOCYV_02055 [Planctomycetota bacterium]
MTPERRDRIVAQLQRKAALAIGLASALGLALLALAVYFVFQRAMSSGSVGFLPLAAFGITAILFVLSLRLARIETRAFLLKNRVTFGREAER